MNPIAKELNDIITAGNPHVLDMLSAVGKNLFFPKGILSQSAEAKKKAHKFNATIGIATEKGGAMVLDSVMGHIPSLPPEQSLTYAPSFGLPALRSAWKEALAKKNPSLSGKDYSLPVVSQAITHGIALLGDMWTDPGDAVILPDKFWGNYNLILSVRRGVRFSHYPLFSEAGGFNVAGLAEAVQKEAEAAGKVVVLLNFPNNPTGYAPTRREAEGIVGVLKDAADAGTNIVAVCDDAYFGLFYEPEVMPESVFGLLAGIHPRILAVKLDGATKEDFVWGLRIGFVTYAAKVSGDASAFYEALEKKTAGAVRGSISNASHLSQSIVLSAMQSGKYDEEKAEKRDVLKRRANRVKQVLAAEKYAGAWEPYPFNSGYFMCLRLKTVEAEPLRTHLLDKYGVGLISLGKTDLRVAFSCLEEADVEELFDLVLAGVRDLEKGAA
ncbi:MAG: aminotransferase class I/II-fold pyridoxal phosphate-dependent enzyme [Deltaproteobacteria bacterium]|nr:aminotransferase class I/II-fold pyridoxal phosphate-dependent enzyme [Deltaproteobacteria bacterium]